MIQEPLPLLNKELKDKWRRNKHVCYMRGTFELTRLKKRYCSGGSTALIIIYIIPIKKLAMLILITWSKWLLQSKLHRKEFRRKKDFHLYSICNF